VQIDVGVLVTIALALLGFIGALLTLIYRAHTGSVQRLQDKLDALEKSLAEEKDARIRKHDESMSRAYLRVETVERELHRVEVSAQKQISDLEVTTVGFGSTYATRRELEQLREDLSGRRRTA
jgi:hypothetical protein